MTVPAIRPPPQSSPLLCSHCRKALSEEEVCSSTVKSAPPILIGNNHNNNSPNHTNTNNKHHAATTVAAASASASTTTASVAFPTDCSSSSSTGSQSSTSTSSSSSSTSALQSSVSSFSSPCEGEDGAAAAAVAAANTPAAATTAGGTKAALLSLKKLRLLDTIAHVQRQYLQSETSEVVFGCLLDGVLELMDSEYGFIGEIKHEINNNTNQDQNDTSDPTNSATTTTTYLQTHAITNISWDAATSAFYEDNKQNGLKFYNLNSLFGAVLVTKESVISNTPAGDARGCGIPPGHPPLNHFLGIPFFKKGGEMNGMVGIANKPGGYTQDDIDFLEPFTVTCGNLIQAYWQIERNKELINDLERKVKERTHELEELNHSLEEANKRVMKASAAQLQHFACMSHEIRTPLNCIIGLSSLLLQETSLTPQQDESIRMIVTSGDLLLTVVNDVLDYSKLASGNVEIDITNANSLQDTLNSIVHSMELKAADKKVKIHTFYDPFLPEYMTTDSRRLQQILYNLLGNAVKFSHPNSIVEVSAELSRNKKKTKHGNNSNNADNNISISACKDKNSDNNSDDRNNQTADIVSPAPPPSDTANKEDDDNKAGPGNSYDDKVVEITESEEYNDFYQDNSNNDHLHGDDDDDIVVDEEQPLETTTTNAKLSASSSAAETATKSAAIVEAEKAAPVAAASDCPFMKPTQTNTAPAPAVASKCPFTKTATETSAITSGPTASKCPFTKNTRDPTTTSPGEVRNDGNPFPSTYDDNGTTTTGCPKKVTPSSLESQLLSPPLLSAPSAAAAATTSAGGENRPFSKSADNIFDFSPATSVKQQLVACSIKDLKPLLASHRKNRRSLSLTADINKPYHYLPKKFNNIGLLCSSHGNNDEDDDGNQLLQNNDNKSNRKTADAGAAAADADILSHLHSSAVDNTTTEVSRHNAENEELADFSLEIPKSDADHVLRLTVKDYGTGISEEDVHRIFSPFVQAGKGTERIYGGTGLGLAITAKLTGALGGNIFVDSAEGKWSKFTVELPFFDSPIDTARISENLSKAKVLIIDKPRSPGGKRDSKFLTVHRVGQVFDAYKVTYDTFETMDDMVKVILQPGYLLEDHSYICLSHEDAYVDEHYLQLASNAKAVLLTFGPTFRNKKSCFHFRSLTQLLPSVLIRNIEESAASAKRIISNKEPSEKDLKIAPAPPTPSPTLSNISMNVLITEDNIINQKVLARTLKRLDVENIDLANNGEEAVQMEMEKHYDLILMDMQMPIMDGLEACILIHGRERKPTDHACPRIVFVTAQVSSSFEADCLRAGATGFLAKPFKIQEVDELLQQVKVSHQPVDKP